MTCKREARWLLTKFSFNGKSIQRDMELDIRSIMTERIIARMDIGGYVVFESE